MAEPRKLSSDSSSHLSEDQFLCSICLEVLTDPVTTPCGHNFCMNCIKTYWSSSQQCQCPFCKETFTKRPELKINTTLREVVDHFKKKSGLEVFCDACTGVKQKALKSCLDCGVTFCKNHLEPHYTVPILTKHKLINPVGNLEDFICQKHKRPLELFCRDDQMCVCQFCTEGDHKTHNTVPIEVESGQKKTQLGQTQIEVQQIIQDRQKKIKNIRHTVELRKRNREKEIADSVEVFTALMRSIERSQAELLEVLEEKQKAAERQAEDLIKDLEQEITKLKRRDTQLEEFVHTEDHLHLLQVYPSVCNPPHTRNWTGFSIVPDLCVETVRKCLSDLQRSLNEKLSNTINEKMRETASTELMKIQRYAVDVTLDPDTAHPNLTLSADGKQVTHGDVKQNLSNSPRRFDYCPCVLGKEGFSSGRFYYEVQVSGKTKWDLGVATESINIKGQLTLRPQNGFWAVTLRNGNKYEVCAGPPIPLLVEEPPQKVGVFVDYEEGLVSFYDVEQCQCHSGLISAPSLASLSMINSIHTSAPVVTTKVKTQLRSLSRPSQRQNSFSRFQLQREQWSYVFSLWDHVRAAGVSFIMDIRPDFQGVALNYQTNFPHFTIIIYIFTDHGAGNSEERTLSNPKKSCT